MSEHKNQCSGCQAGLEIKDNIHYRKNVNGTTSVDCYCTKDRYVPTEENKCECGGWDDNGYQHEPFCPARENSSFYTKSPLSTKEELDEENVEFNAKLGSAVPTTDQEVDEELFGSHEGKLWSKAIQMAMTAPFPEVAMMHVLKRVKERIEKEQQLAVSEAVKKEREEIIKVIEEDIEEIKRQREGCSEKDKEYFDGEILSVIRLLGIIRSREQ